MSEDLKDYLSNVLSRKLADKESELASVKNSLSILPSVDFNHADYRVYVHKVLSPGKGVNFEYQGSLRKAMEGAANKARYTKGHDKNETYTPWDFLVYVKVGNEYLAVPNEMLNKFLP